MTHHIKGGNKASKCLALLEKDKLDEERRMKVSERHQCDCSLQNIRVGSHYIDYNVKSTEEAEILVTKVFAGSVASSFNHCADVQGKLCDNVWYDVQS